MPLGALFDSLKLLRLSPEIFNLGLRLSPEIFNLGIISLDISSTDHTVVAEIIAHAEEACYLKIPLD